MSKLISFIGLIISLAMGEVMVKKSICLIDMTDNIFLKLISRLYDPNRPSTTESAIVDNLDDEITEEESFDASAELFE